MKDKASEWVSVSDLMAGVMAVVMLMLVVSVLQNKAAEAASQVQRQLRESARNQDLRDLLADMQRDLLHSGESRLLDIDVQGRRLVLPDDAFARGSACITPATRNLLGRLALRVAEFMRTHPQAQLLVEGHTDSLPVTRPVTDLNRYCTVYDDNYTLSAARAREARKLLIPALDAGQALRVVVAGYGDSRPRPGLAPQNALNRRVEIQLQAAPTSTGL